MKSLLTAGVLLLFCAVAYSRPAHAAAPATQAATQPATAPANNMLFAIWIANSNPPEYVFVLNNSLAYADINSLEIGLADLPAGSVLTWNPTETAIGREPLSDPDDLKAFKKFCEDHKIKLVIASGG